MKLLFSSSVIILKRKTVPSRLKFLRPVRLDENLITFNKEVTLFAVVIFLSYLENIEALLRKYCPETGVP